MKKSPEPRADTTALAKRPALKNMIGGVFAALALQTVGRGAIAADGAASNEADGEIKAQIWAGEQAIFAGRGRGDVTPYLSVIHPAFLAWPFGATEPFDAEQFIAQNSGDKEFPPGEKITLKSDAMSVSGAMVISYFTTHRTARPGGAPVDERFANIHVWLRHDGAWKVVASMSRPV